MITIKDASSYSRLNLNVHMDMKRACQLPKYLGQFINMTTFPDSVSKCFQKINMNPYECGNSKSGMKSYGISLKWLV